MRVSKSLRTTDMKYGGLCEVINVLNVQSDRMWMKLSRMLVCVIMCDI